MHFSRIAAFVLAVVGMSSSWAYTINFDLNATTPIPMAPEDGTPLPPVQTFGSAVLGYYNGDPDYKREGAQNLNTTFSDSAMAICSSAQQQDCKGNFPDANSGITAVGSVNTNDVSFTVSPGLFISQLSFYYNAAGSGSRPGVQLYSGGSSVYSKALEECGGTEWCDWKLFTVPIDELAGKLITQVGLFGTPNTVVFDDVSVTTSTTTPIPEPSTYALMLLGLAGLAAASRRRAR